MNFALAFSAIRPSKIRTGIIGWLLDKCQPPLPKWVGLKSDLTELPKRWTGRGAVLGLVKDLEGRQVYSVIILALVWLQMVKSICFSILIAISFSYLLASHSVCVLGVLLG